jgi:hypothetical protein
VVFDVIGEMGLEGGQRLQIVLLRMRAFDLGDRAARRTLRAWTRNDNTHMIFLRCRILIRPMSARGQNSAELAKTTHPFMSAVPPIPTKNLLRRFLSRSSRKYEPQQRASLFDHFVSLGKQCR